MIHFFYGPDPTLLLERAKAEFASKVDLDDPLQYVRLDAGHDTVQDIVLEALSSSFFGGTKVVVAENCYYLTAGNERAPAIDRQQDFKALEDYLHNPNPETELYLLGVGKPNTKSGLVKLLQEKALVTEISSLTDEDFVAAALRLTGAAKADIDREAIAEVVLRSERDYTLFLNNIKKLLSATSTVRLADVEELINKPLSDDVFALFEALVKDVRPTNALKIARSLLRLGYDANRLLPVLASQFRFLSEVAYLSERGATERQIADELRCHPYRVSCARRNLRRLGFRLTVQIMSDLADLEQGIKFELDDPEDSLELFIVGFRERYLQTAR